MSGRTLRSYYEASIEMGIRDLNNSRMVQWTIPVPSVQPNGMDILGFPCEGTALRCRGPLFFLPDAVGAVLMQANGLLEGSGELN